ncbi:MAG: hypothetical protein Q4B78_03695 [Bacillota bacterium]|nr:hypothetical protein [Bacillota bacterium]
MIDKILLVIVVATYLVLLFVVMPQLSRIKKELKEQEIYDYTECEDCLDDYFKCDGIS